MNLRALYVEDNTLDADLARRALARAVPPIELDVSTTVADAIARLRADAAGQGRDHQRYKWVLFDLTLPDGDGLQVLRHVREQQLPLAAVVLSGTGDEKAVIHALKLGVDDYVIKQGDYLERLPAVLRVLHERSAPAYQRHERPLNVLYVENNPQDGQLTARHLASSAPHLRLDVLDEGREGDKLRERLLRGQPEGGGYDILLLDYLLTDLDALELTKAVRGEMGLDLPIVIVTGRGSEEVAVQALRLGVSDYVIKDANYLERLPHVLEFAYARAQLMRERERMRKSESDLLKLTQQVPGVITVTRYEPGRPGTTPFASDALGQVFELTREDVCESAAGFVQRIHPDDRGRVLSVHRQVIDTLEATTCEYRLLLPAKGERWVESQVTPERQSDGTVLLYSYTFDITERKRYAEILYAAEAAKRANLAKTEFLSRMSHELRTPLNAVIGFAQILQSDDSDPISDNQRRQVQHIERAGDLLLAMISEVLDLSRIEAGSLTLNLGPLPVADLCQEAMALVAESARRAQVNLILQSLPKGLLIQADPVRFKQVLVNLLTNAIKYNRMPGEVMVRVEPRDGQVVLQVSDVGRGMSRQQLVHLFEPFNRLGAERTSVEGTGIGLVIVQKLVELMQGRLQIDSVLGQGTCVTVILPQGEAPAPLLSDAAPLGGDAAEQAGADGKDAATASATPCVDVLYAEDNEVNVDLMRQVLALREGYQLRVARSGTEAIVMALSEPPDILLMDMHLGDMDGVAVAQALHGHPGLHDVPFIALSADALPDQIQRAQDHGFAAYLTKPVDVMGLLACLDQHLRI